MTTFDPGVTILAGPSGVGKDTIVDILLQKHPELVLGRSLTTRPQRDDDRPGRYENIADDTTEFMARAKRGELLEWAQYGRYLYGTLRTNLDLPHDRLLLVATIDGVADLLKQIPDARCIFLAPPGNSLDVLEQRLAERGTDDRSTLQDRLDAAADELARGPQMADLVIINDDADTAANEISQACFSYL